MSLPSSATLTRNVTRVFRTATPDQIGAGADWYADAHRIAQALATAHNLTVGATAGIIAALSPLNSWGANVNLATRLITAGGLTSGYLGAGLAKANAILGGADPVAVLTSPKVFAFYVNILTAGQTDTVCIDRHAYDIATNTRNTDDTRPAIGKRAHRDLEAAYQRAARILSKESGETVTASQVQAITWVTWRARYWSAGAFDVK